MLRPAVLLSVLTPLAWVNQRAAQPPLFVQSPSSPIAAGAGPSNMAVADMDGDGHLDLLTTRSREHTVDVRYGNGRLVFTPEPGRAIRLDEPPSELAVGDMNGDGRLDIGVAKHDSYEVDILLGRPDRGFVAAPGSPVAMSASGKAHTHGFALADVNEDGQLDAVSGNNEDENVAVLLGNGRGGFSRAPRSPFHVGSSPYPFGIGDLDGDGHVDLAAPNSGTGRSVGPGRSVTVLRGNGRGSFGPPAPVPTAMNPYFVALGALGGGPALAIAASHDSGDLLTLLLNDGKGNFAPAAGSPYRLGARAFSVVARDVNRDARTDLVAASGNSVRVLLGGEQGLTPAPGSPFRAGAGAWYLALGDLNEDGKVDIATSDLEAGTITILLGN